MLTLGDNALALRIAGALKARCARGMLPSAAADAGFSLEDAVAKCDRALAGLANADCKTLGAIAQRLGACFSDDNLEELGLGVLAEGEPPTAKIMRRDIARLFGHDVPGERAFGDILRPLWPIDTIGDDFFSGLWLVQQIVQHTVTVPGS